ncbi:DoxX family membrane protein [Dyella subtropica]|uniref:DoxX family membrane protein n=1 Tax=Dyella subtropica TaxID=2992127 RepID=UPI0022597A20|nr:DoxX family membrane protein [Dyella subtropica]
MASSVRESEAPFEMPVLRTDDLIVDAGAGQLSWSHAAFALTMISLGILGFIYGDFALDWQRIPIEHLPARSFFAYAFAAIELVTGVGLLIRSTAKLVSAALLIFLLLWAVLLKLPAVLSVPQMEATWLGLGEITVILAGGWVLFALHARDGKSQTFATGAKGVRNARLLFALSLPMIGLSHFFYSPQTVELMPAWLPYHLGWAYLTGAGSIAACIGVLFGFLPRLAATLEAAMLGIITLVIWGPGLFTHSTDRMQWTAFVISAAIACGAWVVADSYRGAPWLAGRADGHRL